MEQLFFSDRARWRQWLADHHQRSPGIWVIFYKKDCRRIVEAVTRLNKGLKLGLK